MDTLDLHTQFVSNIQWFLGGMLEKDAEVKFLEHALECGRCGQSLAAFFDRKDNEFSDRGHIPAGVLAKWPAVGDQMGTVERNLTTSHLEKCLECQGARMVLEEASQGKKTRKAIGESQVRGPTRMLEEILMLTKRRQGQLGSITPASLPEGIFEDVLPSPESEPGSRTAAEEALRSQVRHFSTLVSSFQERREDAETLIQQELLPPRRLRSGAIDVATASIPCQAVAADFIDVLDLGKDGVGLALADVPGRGPVAAQLSAMFQGLFIAQEDHFATPVKTVRRINRALARRDLRSRMITFFYGVISRDGEFSYCNAGHTPPILLRKDGSFEKLEVGGIPLGIFEKTAYEEGHVQISKGEMVFVFSDGVSEAVGPTGQVRIEDVLQPTFKKLAKLDAAGAQEEVLLFLTGFLTENGPLADDLSVTVAKLEGSK